MNYTEDIYVGYRYFETLPGMKDKVVYPFGYGLSYTRFELKIISAEEAEGEIRFGIRVGNTGNYPGKEVVQVYYEAPAGKLGKPARALAAFAKTGLLQPGEYQELALSFPVVAMASFDDLGRIVRSVMSSSRENTAFISGKMSGMRCGSRSLTRSMRIGSPGSFRLKPLRFS